jgi:hypothetical protein
MEPKADIALIGLAVMDQNLILNMNDHGFTVVENFAVPIWKSALLRFCLKTTRGAAARLAHFIPPRRNFERLLQIAQHRCDHMFGDGARGVTRKNVCATGPRHVGEPRLVRQGRHDGTREAARLDIVEDRVFAVPQRS